MIGRRGKRGVIKFAWVSLLTALPAAAVAAILFLKAGDWLVISEPLPERIDVVFTFAGENSRMAYSRELMGRFPEAHWVLSENLHQYSRILEREGFDMSRVTPVDTCTNTLSEVNGLADWVRGRRGSDAARARAVKAEPISIALVSNPYHMRRIHCMVDNVFRGDSLRFFYLPVPRGRYRWAASADSKYWWQSKVTRSWVESEVAKLFLFWLFS